MHWDALQTACARANPTFAVEGVEERQVVYF